MVFVPGISGFVGISHLYSLAKVATCSVLPHYEKVHISTSLWKLKRALQNSPNTSAKFQSKLSVQCLLLIHISFDIIQDITWWIKTKWNYRSIFVSLMFCKVCLFSANPRYPPPTQQPTLKHTFSHVLSMSCRLNPGLTRISNFPR